MIWRLVPRYSVVCLAFGCWLGAEGLAKDFFISPAGTDANSGGIDQPFATLNRALQAARQYNLEITNAPEEIHINLRRGRYEVTEPIALTELDSGSQGRPTVIRSCDGLGEAVLSGGRWLRGWQDHEKGIYKVHWEGAKPFHTLIENGVRARKARYPNYEYAPQYPLAQAHYLLTTGRTDSRFYIQYDPLDLHPESWSRIAAQICIWSGGGWEWFMDIAPLASVDLTNHEFMAGQELRYPAYSSSPWPPNRSRYFVQGLYDFLDAPGEFHYDAEARMLYYIPLAGKPADDTVQAPQAASILRIQGHSRTNLAHDVTLDGLCFEVTDFAGQYRFGWPRAGDSGESHLYPAYDRQVNLPEHRQGMLYLENVERIAIRHCWLRHAGYSAIYLETAAREVRIEDNLIEHGGYFGIYLNGPYPGEGDSMSRNVISNNLIRSMGEILGHGGGIFIMNSSSNLVSHCEIAQSPREGVSLGGLPDIPDRDLYTHDNRVEYCRILQQCQDSGDTAPFYLWGAISNSANQIIIDGAYHHPSGQDKAPFGFYLDNGANGQVAHNLVVTNIQSLPFLNNEAQNYVMTNVSWHPRFNPDFIEWNAIGLTPDFPYAPFKLTVIPGETNLTLAWPDRYSNVVIQAAAALDPSSAWTNIHDPRIHGPGTNLVLPEGWNQRFFRAMKMAR